MNPIPARIPWAHLLCIALCSAISLAWGISLARTTQDGMGDFQTVFYGARCLLHHHDPYRPSEFLKVYLTEESRLPTDPSQLRPFLRAVPICVNLPASLFLMLPLEILPWSFAEAVWVILTAGSLLLAGLLAWSLARTRAPGVALFLVCVVLADCEILIAYGNLSGIVGSLCVVAVWCFLRNRFVAAGVVCLAVSLAIKPHNAGLIWLYFLLAGGVQRKRAGWVLCATAAISLCAVLWVAPVVPRWLPELRDNLQATTAEGDLNDPGPTSMVDPTPDAIISLQALLSFLRNTPQFYNPVAYLLCGTGVLLWVLKTIHLRSTRIDPWLALAPLLPLTLLVTYHRCHDAKLLLLAIPACVILWNRRGWLRWLAFAVTTASILSTSDLFMTVSILMDGKFPARVLGSFAPAVRILLTRPAPVALSAMALFYLWLYLRHSPQRAMCARHLELPYNRVTQP